MHTRVRGLYRGKERKLGKTGVVVMSTAKASGAALVSPTWRQNRRPIRLIIPTPIRQARPTGGDSPPGSPADSSSVRELLRGFGCTRGGSGGGDDGGLGEDGADGKCGSGAFGANRLVKLTVLGKGERRKTRAANSMYDGALCSKQTNAYLRLRARPKRRQRRDADESYFGALPCCSSYMVFFMDFCCRSKREQQRICHIWV